jgi:FkbM family methyltransferase
MYRAWSNIKQVNFEHSLIGVFFMSDNPSNVPPTKEYLRNKLQYGLLSDSDLAAKSWFGRPGYVSSEAEHLGRNRSRVVRVFIRLAYGNKEKIKSIPILNKLAFYTKDRLMKKRSNTTVRASLDLSPVLGLELDDFIQNLYLRALGRKPDAVSFDSAKQALLSGMPKEGLVYLVCTSEEFADRAPVVHLDEYRKKYTRYIRRERIRRLPFIGLPFQIRAMERQLASLTTALETANQNIINANVKIDNTAILITDSFNKNKPIVYGIPGGVTVIQMEKFIFGVPSEDWRLAKYLSQGGTFEPGSEKYFCSILREGMVVLDVGAYLGIYTLHALTAGCTVYSYEPTPQIFKILADNIGMNGFEPTGRSHAYNVAVSDTDGEVEFNLFINGQNNSIFNREEDGSKTKLRSVCLDTHLSHLDQIDVVKIDVEGAEPLALHGMKKIIASNPRIKIIMEFAPSNLKRGGSNPVEFIKMIRAMGLDIHAIDEISGKILNTNDEELCKAFSTNLLLEKAA